MKASIGPCQKLMLIHLQQCSSLTCACNINAAGFISARLRGEYKVTRDDRIDLEFRNITLSIGPFKAAEKVCAV